MYESYIASYITKNRLRLLYQTYKQISVLEEKYEKCQTN